MTNRKNFFTGVNCRKVIIVGMLLSLGFADLCAQSLYTPRGKNSAAFQFSSTSLKPENAFEFLLSFSNSGILDFGLGVGSSKTFREQRFSFPRLESGTFISPQVGVLLIKSEGGFNLSANTGLAIQLKSEYDNQFVYGFSMSQRLGTMDSAHILPFISLSRNVQAEKAVLGAGLSLVLGEPTAGFVLVTGGIQRIDERTEFTIALGYVFKSQDRKNKTGQNAPDTN